MSKESEKYEARVMLGLGFLVFLLLSLIVVSIKDCSTSKHARDAVIAQEQVKQTQALIKRSESSDCVLLVVPPVPVPQHRD